MKGIIIYKSNYGSTEQYARWLSEDTGFPCVDVGSVKKRDIEDCEAVVCGSPVFAGKHQISGWMRKNWKRLAGKKIALFSVSGAPPGDPSLEKAFEASFPPEIRADLKYVQLGGRLIFSELKPLHRRLMNLGMRMTKDPQIRETMGKDKDFVDRSGLAPLVAYLR